MSLCTAQRSTGVATATIISKVINLSIVIIFSCTLVKAGRSPERLSNGTVLSQIIKVGLPSAFESMLYNVAMMLVVKFLNQMDADGLNVTARSYASQISNFSFCAGSALAQANAIMTGWHIGAGDIEACKRDTKKAAMIGVIVATCLESLFAVTAPWTMKLFTDNPDMIHIVTRLLTIDIILEIGRVTNLVYGQALKTSGDAVFPASIAAVFMFVCAPAAHGCSDCILVCS
nr:MATE family efflux transporter [Coprococcus sp. OM06-25]